MIRRTVLVLLLGVIIGAFFFVPSALAATYSDEEIAFAQLLNDYRVSEGLEALLVSDALSDAGDKHSSDMGKYAFFAHTTAGSDWFPIGASPWDRMAMNRYGFNTYKGENIAGGYSTAAPLFEAWKNSPAHNANMLNPNFTVVGVSLVYVAGSPYGYYWTTDFGGYVDSTAHSLTAPSTTTTTITAPPSTTTTTLPPSTTTTTEAPVPAPFPEEIFTADAELYVAAFWAVERGIFQGYPDGTFRPHEPVLRRHVALVAKRTGILAPPWEDDYAAATRGQVRDAIPGLTWLEERWDESLTRSQLLRLMYRAREGIAPAEFMAAKLDAWFAEAVVTWRGTTRTPRLVGYGGLMLEQAREHNVPLWLALGQAWRESQWGTTGLSIEHNMLWGVKDTSGKWGTLRGVVSGFADYISVDENIRAYFRLMDSPVYRGFIDAADWRGLLNRYAPAFENDTAEHYQIVMTVRRWTEERGIE